MEKITLLVNGKEQVFTSQFIPMRIYRQFLEANKRIDLTDLSAEDMDELIGMICSAYNNQFTIDDFYDGMPTEKFQDVFEDFVVSVKGGKKPDPNHPAQGKPTQNRKPRQNSTKK